MIEILKSLFTRDLNLLKKEIETYQKEENLWMTDRNISNSAGNLCLHLMGNISAFIGAELGKTGYVRNRELEFSLKNIPREKLAIQIQDTLETTLSTLNQLKEEDLKKDYPIMVFGDKMTTEFFLIHLISHLNYHLGQINYHRRLFDI